MQRTQFTGAVLIVEGTTDQRFFNNLPIIDKQACQVVAGHSKAKALEVLDILEREQFLGVLAIVDADFMRVEGKVPLSPNCILTDHHDLEISLILSPALDKFLSEYGSADKIKHFQAQTGKDVRAKVLELSLYLGYLLWHSLRENLALTFEDLDFLKFIDYKTLVIDHLVMIRTVKHHSQKPGIVEAEILQRLHDLAAQGHDPAQICCGHDAVAILALGLRSVWGTHDAKALPAEHVTKNLRLSFESAHFAALPLYAAITTWEQTNPPYTVLAKGSHAP